MKTGARSLTIVTTHKQPEIESTVEATSLRIWSYFSTPLVQVYTFKFQ